MIHGDTDDVGKLARVHEGRRDDDTDDVAEVPAGGDDWIEP